MAYPLNPEDYDDMVKRMGRVGAFAPGEYYSQCVDCNVMFRGDKRALNCLPCAVSHLSTPPEAARQVDPEIIGDVSSLIAARCVALPGKLIDCPVCGAVDNERARLAGAVTISEEMVERAHEIAWPATEWGCEECTCREVMRAALTAALSAPMGDQGALATLRLIHEGYQVNHSSKWVHRIVSEALAQASTDGEA